MKRYQFSYSKEVMGKVLTFVRVFMCYTTQERAIELAQEHCKNNETTLVSVIPTDY
jgi:hypothetical protein